VPESQFHRHSFGAGRRNHLVLRHPSFPPIVVSTKAKLCWNSQWPDIRHASIERVYEFVERIFTGTLWVLSAVSSVASVRHAPLAIQESHSVVLQRHMRPNHAFNRTRR
jgi:hypothetical protein